MNPAQLALQQTKTPFNSMVDTNATPSMSEVLPTMSKIEPPNVPPSPEAIKQAQAQQSQSNNQQNSASGNIDYNQLKKEGYSPTQIESYLSQNPGVQLKNAPSGWDASIQQDSIIPEAAPITERFGQNQPGVEVFSGGFTSGTGIGVKSGTPVALPPGQWKVVDMFDGAKQKGFIGDSDGQGWGNNVVVQNTQTGEELRYSHLSQIDVANGDSLNGSRVIGLSGESGNVTGPHLNLEYMTPDGKPADVLQSQYAAFIPVSE